jgi:carboxylesterase type B
MRRSFNCFVCFACLQAHLVSGVVVDIPGLGSVLGEISDASDVVSFRGIPYSKAPLRWQPAGYPHDGWNETLDARKFKKICWQEASVVADPAAMSEDCL